MSHPEAPRINLWSRALRERFGGRVQRVALDAGMSCPNVDGTVTTGGCIFCDASGSRAPYAQPALSLRDQLARGIERLGRRFGAERFIAYLQPRSNTHAPAERLRAIFTEALDHPQVVGLALGTRADCLPDAVLDLLAEINTHRPVWLEVGLQSASDKTLRWMNRAHTVAQWREAVDRAKARGLFVATHLILGLPTDTPADGLRAMELLNHHGIDGVKFHMLCVDRHARLASLHRLEPLRLLTREEYARAVCDRLERLSPDTQVMRLVSDCPADRLVAPTWLADKAATLRLIDQELVRRDTRQGSLLAKATDR
ncbi:TIGR01212 family radical SAM protein [Candidatus Sumerlaeota bacterium]|nr:TIGR01212 family radical SAM protein [Candidatus Sumerlaeota bacterium]